MPMLHSTSKSQKAFPINATYTLLTTLLALTITACSSSNSGEVGQGNSNFAGNPFEESGLPGTALKAVLIDSVEPAALNKLAQLTMSAKSWVDSSFGSNFDLLPLDRPIITQDDQITDEFNCDTGSVSRTEFGNPLTKTVSLDFTECTIDSVLYNGSATNVIHAFECDGPNLRLEFNALTVSIENTEVLSATGVAEYNKGAVDCSAGQKGSGGTPGYFWQLLADLESLTHTQAGSTIALSNLQLDHSYRLESAISAGIEHEIDLNVIVNASSISPNDITMALEEPLLITSAETEQNFGALNILMNGEVQVSYKLVDCSKDMVNVTTIQGSSETESILTWDDPDNLLAQLNILSPRVASTAVIDSQAPELESPYNPNQSVDGC